MKIVLNNRLGLLVVSHEEPGEQIDDYSRAATRSYQRDSPLPVSPFFPQPSRFMFVYLVTITKTFHSSLSMTTFTNGMKSIQVTSRVPFDLFVSPSHQRRSFTMENVMICDSKSRLNDINESKS
jgi:hypothetical protein